MNRKGRGAEAVVAYFNVVYSNLRGGTDSLSEVSRSKDEGIPITRPGSRVRCCTVIDGNHRNSLRLVLIFLVWEVACHLVKLRSPLAGVLRPEEKGSSHIIPACLPPRDYLLWRVVLHEVRPGWVSSSSPLPEAFIPELSFSTQISCLYLVSSVWYEHRGSILWFVTVQKKLYSFV